MVARGQGHDTLGEGALRVTRPAYAPKIGVKRCLQVSDSRRSGCNSQHPDHVDSYKPGTLCINRLYRDQAGRTDLSREQLSTTAYLHTVEAVEIDKVGHAHGDENWDHSSPQPRLPVPLHDP